MNDIEKTYFHLEETYMDITKKYLKVDESNIENALFQHTGVYAFFVCYMAEQMLISMVKNLPADQSIVFFINILQGMLRDINETYIQKRK